MHRFLLLPLLIMTLSACATTSNTDSDVIYDPFESVNRKVYGFNESVDKAVIGPVARAYNNNVPKPARHGLRNFLANANAPVTFVNDILQAKPQRAAETFSRFVINSTVGLGGLFDVAGKSDLEGHTEDFGQTMAVWGVPQGAYVMSPFLGPSTLRDTVGGIVDNAFDPLTWVEFGLSDLDVFINAGRVGAGVIDTRSRLEPALQSLRAQPEPYTALRRAYANNRESAIRDGVISADIYDDLPDFDDFDDFEDE